MAAATLNAIGDGAFKAALKQLIALPPADDPNDELKGVACAATWPERLNAKELFDALTPPKKANFAGE